MWTWSFSHTGYNGIITRVGQKAFSNAFCKVSQDFLIYSLFIFKRKRDFTKVFGSSQDRFAIRVVSLKGLDPKLEVWVRVTECRLLFWQHKELGHISYLALSENFAKIPFFCKNHTPEKTELNWIVPSFQYNSFNNITRWSSQNLDIAKETSPTYSNMQVLVYIAKLCFRIW